MINYHWPLVHILLEVNLDLLYKSETYNGSISDFITTRPWQAVFRVKERISWHFMNAKFNTFNDLIYHVVVIIFCLKPHKISEFVTIIKS